jgi:hypothetical protein
VANPATHPLAGNWWFDELEAEKRARLDELIAVRREEYAGWREFHGVPVSKKTLGKIKDLGKHLQKASDIIHGPDEGLLALSFIANVCAERSGKSAEHFMANLIEITAYGDGAAYADAAQEAWRRCQEMVEDKWLPPDQKLAETLARDFTDIWGQPFKRTFNPSADDGEELGWWFDFVAKAMSEIIGAPKTALAVRSSLIRSAPKKSPKPRPDR